MYRHEQKNKNKYDYLKKRGMIREYHEIHIKYGMEEEKRDKKNR